MSFYENLVMKTQMNYSRYYRLYAEGKTPYRLSEKQPLPYGEQIRHLVREIRQADCVVVGGASGLSAAGGGDFYYEDNDSFRRYFGRFAEKYHFQGAFDGMMRPWEDRKEFWGYLATFLHTTQTAPVRQPYLDLDFLLRGKDFHILTTNQDTQFIKLYPEEQVSQIQGDHRFFQCSRCCRDDTWDAVKPVENMIEAMGEGTAVPEELIPRCPVCGGLMQVHMEMDGNFIPETESRNRLKRFLEKYHGKKLLILELGIGWRNQLIKAPLMRLTAREPRAFYVTVNRGEIYIPQEIMEKSTGLDGDLSEILHRLAGEMEGKNHV